MLRRDAPLRVCDGVVMLPHTIVESMRLSAAQAMAPGRACTRMPAL
jgi:hypothetical protein